MKCSYVSNDSPICQSKLTEAYKFETVSYLAAPIIKFCDSANCISNYFKIHI